MIFLADESVDFNIVEALRSFGYSISAIVEDVPGISDAEVLALAVEQEAILLTEDKDFGELVVRFQIDHAGILLLRLEGIDVQKKVDLVFQTLEKHGKEIHNNFATLTIDKLRIRKVENR